jgi:hypothetical protein
LNALSVAFLVSSTAILAVILGIFGAYCAICGILAAVNRTRPSHALRALVPHQGNVNGD